MSAARFDVDYRLCGLPVSSLRRCTALTPLALALLALTVAPAQAQFSSTGVVNVFPGNAAVPNGPGNADLGNVGLFVGNGAPGSFSAMGGSLLRVGSLLIGPSGAGNGDGTVVLDGAGTKVSLVGDGFGNGVINRFGVGEWGKGAFTVSGGATLDGRAESASCLGQFHYCNNFVGNAAGSTGVFTVTGAGSNASFLRFFGVGGLAVFHPPIDSFTFGTPGGTTRGTVNVLAGGLLTTDNIGLGLAPGGGSPQGNERSFADVTIDGAGSLWRVMGGTLEPNQYANVSTATHRNAWATLAITGGGEMRLEGDGAKYTILNLSSGGGRTDMLISGAGSRLHFAGQSGIFNIGTSAFGTAAVDMRNGALADGMFYTGVGRNGGTASLLVDGAGTLLRIDGTATAAANGNSAPAYMEIGRNGGNGTVTVSNGGRIEVLATLGATNGTGMGIGRDANSAGTLNIQSAGVVLFRSSSSAPGTAAETANPSVLVGREGSGNLNISSGGKLLLEGGGVSTPTNRRSTNLFIGGLNDTAVGGRGIATVTGAGSEIKLTGQDTFIGVGVGPQSSGQLTVSNQGLVSAIGMNVGRSGGIGVLKVDGASLSFSGQQTSGSLAGGFLVIGSGGGTGVATLSNASVVTLSNPGSSGAGLSLGGSSVYAGGDGSLTLSGGSRIDVVAAPGLGGVTVGREGSGFLRLRDASQLNIAGGLLQVGRYSGSDGTLIASEASSITADWVGVGRQKVGSGDIDGGTGTLVLINSALTAQTIVIGSNGFLGGTGTITGNVTNFGIFAPGNSPGTMEISGAFSAQAGSRMILEVQGDGHGGFATDRVIFGGGQALDLAHLKVEFRFLGGTNPNDFQAQQLFDIDTFFQLRTVGGGTANLVTTAFAGATFSAQADAYTVSNFSFSAADGARFTATPVPEPASLAMLLAGLALLGGWAQRARAARERG